MPELNHKIEQIEEIVSNPRMMLEKYLNEGKKVVGCFEMYTPEEIAHAAGMIPMGVWGGQVELSLAKKYFPPFVCSIMQSTLELGLRGSYNGLSAVLIPILCDTLRGVSQNWKSAVEIPAITFTFPQNRALEASITYLISEYEYVKEELEKISSNKITDEALKKSIMVYNDHNAIMREFADIANLHLDIITPNVRHNIMKSTFFVEKAEHTRMIRDIIARLKEYPAYEWKGKRVILTGITAEPREFLNILKKIISLLSVTT